MRVDFESLWERLPKAPVRFLGWGLIGMWTNVMYLHPAVAFPDLPGNSRIVFDLILITVMMAAAMLARFLPGFAPLIGRRWAPPCALALLLASTSVSFSAAIFGSPSPMIMWAALIAGGIGTAIMMLLISEFYGLIHPKRTILYMSLGWLAGMTSAVFLRALPPSYLWVCMMAIPVVMLLCLWRSYASLSASELSLMPNSRFSFPLLPLIPIVLCAAVKRGLNVLVLCDLNMEAVNDAGMIVAAVVVLAGLALRGGNLNMRALWKLGVALMAASIAAFAVYVWAGLSAVAFAAALGTVVLSTTAYYLLFLLMTVILANISYRWGVCALWLFAIENATHLLAGTGAMVGMEWLMCDAGVGTGVLDAAFTLFSLAAMVVISLLFKRFSPDSLWGLSIGDEEAFGESERLRCLCEKLIDEGGLTQREGEVLFMCMQGKRPATIAEELFVGVSTVRTHIKHLYAKLGVHSRKELMELIGARTA